MSLLQCIPDAVKLGYLFFLNMKNLRVLELNQAKIESLLASISSLVNLISLFLNGCAQLAKLPPEVKMLKKIEFLDIRGTSNPYLPQEIGDMIQLRCLRVSFAPKGCGHNSKGQEVEVMIPPNIICRLQHLEELTIEMGCCSPMWNNIADQMAIELASLEKLTTLSFHFPTVNTLKGFVTTNKSWKNTETHWKNNTFKSFKISVGCCETQHPYRSKRILAERQLRFPTNKKISTVKEVLKQASTFELVGHLKVESLSESDLGNAGALKVCVVDCCNNLLNIVDANKTNDGGVLECLEKLHLFNPPLVQSIWKASVFQRSLSNLKVLIICGCHELMWTLNHKLAEALSSLKHLKVENCLKIVEIIIVQGHIDGSCVLQKVKTIELINLPNLESISKSGSVMWNSSIKIVVVCCRELRNLPSTLSNAKKLEIIKSEESWWTTFQLSEEEKQYFRPRCDFIIVEKESSSNRRSVNVQALDNNDSQICNSGNGHGEAMPSSGSSNADIVCGA